MPIPGVFRSTHGIPFFPPSVGGIVRIRFKGKEMPILFDEGLDFEGGLGYILRQFGEVPFVPDLSEKEAKNVFFAANAGGEIGAKRRRFKFVPVNVGSLQSVHPSLAKAGEVDIATPVVEMIEIEPA